MLTIANSAALARALESPLEPVLKSLLCLRRDQLMADGIDEIGDIARYIIVEPGDAIEAIEAEMAVPIATNIANGSRYPDPSFQPNWEWCIRHGTTIWEAPFILSDDGAGVVLITMEQEGIDAILLRLCHTYGTMEDAQ